MILVYSTARTSVDVQCKQTVETTADRMEDHHRLHVHLVLKSRVTMPTPLLCLCFEAASSSSTSDSSDEKILVERIQQQHFRVIMASLLDRLGRIFKSGYAAEQKRKKICHRIRMNENPEDVWQIIGELGDGAFGKVYKVR